MLFLLSWLRDSNTKSKPSSSCIMYQQKKHLHQGGSKLWKIILFLLISWATCKMKDSIFLYFFKLLIYRHSFLLSEILYLCLSQDMPKIHQNPRRKNSASSATELGLWSKFLQDLRALHRFYFPTSHTVPIFLFSHLKKVPSNKAQYNWKICSNALKFESPHAFCWRGESNAKPCSFLDITQRCWQHAIETHMEKNILNVEKIQVA